MQNNRQANELLAIRFTMQEVWCIFRANYLTGLPISDSLENEEAVFMPVEEVLTSDAVVDTTKELVKSMLDENKSMLQKSDFVNKKFDGNTWQLFIYA